MVAPATAARTCGGKAATIVGTPKADELRGTPRNDVITGLGGNDRINGLGGNDLICGGKGHDLLQGGRRGDDRLLGGPGYDDLRGGQDDDVLVAGRGGADLVGGMGDDIMRGGPGRRDSLNYSYSSGNNGVIVDLAAGTATGAGTDTITGVEVVRGTFFDDSLTGDAGPNVLIGMDGDDTLVGGGGGRLSSPRPGTSSFGLADSYYGGTGDDTLVGSSDFDMASWVDAPAPMTINLAAGVATGEGNDTLSEIEGVHSSRNGDTITGDSADNAFALEGGADDVRGGGGRDLVFVTAYAPDGVTLDLVAGTSTGGGDDSLLSIEVAWGTPFNDTLLGDAGPNELRGRDGNDSLSGREGDDDLIGGPGEDTLDGGPGTDSCAGGESLTACE